MARDSRIRMRNGLVIPGVLLVFYGVLAIVYAEVFRARSDFCADSNRILIAGLCYSVRNLIIPLVVIGFALILTGALAFKSKPDSLEGHLHHGTPTHVALAVLVSWVGASGITLIVQLIRQGGGKPFELTVLGARYQHTFLLELLLLVGLLALVPFLGLYISNHRRRRAFLEAAAAIGDGSDALPHEPAFDYADTAKAAEVQASNMVPDDEWPEGRDAKLDLATAPAATVVGCLARDLGRSCTQPVREGARFCATHGCQGETKDGRPCRNQATSDGWCQIHVVAERQA